MTHETKPNIHGLSSIYFCNETTIRGPIVIDDDGQTESVMKEFRDQQWNKYRGIADKLVEKISKEQLELQVEKELLEYDQLKLMQLEDETARTAQMYAQVRAQLIAKEMERQRLKREFEAVKAQMEQIYSAKAGNTGTIARFQGPDNSSMWLKLRLLVKGKKSDKKKSKRCAS